MYNALPAGVSIVFELSGDGGGDWTVSKDRYSDVHVVRHSASRPHCRLRCSVDDFTALIRGELNVRKAFVDELIDVTGDVGLVWKLQKLLVARKGA